MAALGNKPRGRGRGRARGGFGSPGGGGGSLVKGANRGVDPGFSPFGGKPRGGGGNGNGGTTAPSALGEGRPARGRGRKGGSSPRQKSAIGNQALPGPGGRQLEARVQSGKITQQQAQRTMQQRQTLRKAFGPDWRDKLAVGGKSFAQVRKGLAKNPGSPKLAAINKKLLANRKAALEAARTKLSGDEGEGGKKKKAQAE